MAEKNKVKDLYENSKGSNGSPKFDTKRQASKYLNHYGEVWKAEHDIDIKAGKRTGKEMPKTKRSHKNINKKKKR